MKKEYSADIAIVGAGIVGLAHAYMALRKGHKVVLFERDDFAVGASVRNFGLIWPIGQAPGQGLTRALRSCEHWLEVALQAKFWAANNGSMHLAYHQDEWQVLEEFSETIGKTGYDAELINPQKVAASSPRVNPNRLKGALSSHTELTVDPREAVRRIPLWLEEKFNLILRFGSTVKEISIPYVKTTRENWKVDHVLVCNGADFETLYPEFFAQNKFVKCKLQMMKLVTEDSFKLGPALCAGLTLRHYPAFSKCKSLGELNRRYDENYPEYREHGIHLLLAQNGNGEFIAGDSHHYGKTVDPFDREDINSMILNYLHSFITLGDYRITERWHGVYPQLESRNPIVFEPEQNVTIINGLGGAGMTLSFGLAEEVINKL